MEYKNHNIVVMQFAYVFQYLFADLTGKNIYQDHIDYQPTLIKRITYKLGFIDSPYSTEERDSAEEVVLSGAVKTIDELLDKKQIED